MKKLLLFIIILFSFSVGFSQVEIVTVISIKANVRGTPDNRGAVVTTVIKGEKFELLNSKGAWYLIQTPKYVGWIHGNNIKTEGVDFADKQKDELETFLENQKKRASSDNLPDLSKYAIKSPKKTTKPLTSEDSPFENEYVGGDSDPWIKISNDTNRTVWLTFGDKKYFIEPSKNISITFEPGNYEYYVTADRVRPLSGVRKYESGHIYTWRFYIGR